MKGYEVEHRATAVLAEGNKLTLKITPAPRTPWVHPVFVIERAPKAMAQATLDGKLLGEADYAWDGTVLWLNRTLESPATLQVVFADAPSE